MRRGEPPTADDFETTSKPPTRRGDALLLIVDAASGTRSVELPIGKPSFVIGRAPTCDVVVDDPSVSRRHAIVRVDEMTIEELGSRNGTKIQGATIGTGLRVPIALGTAFELGEATFVLRRSAPRAPAAQATTARGPIVVDAKMCELYRTVDVVAKSSLAILILGETGVGKEIYAEEVHGRSTRANEPFLRLNCAAFTESLLEAELFGFERGAFTGAVQAKGGLFEAAHKGTIFLDEVGDLPLAMQAKLLRVLESGEVMRLGSVKPKKVDVRFISATNADPRRLVAEGRFRSDLYYRVAGTTVTIPPLRDRPADLEPLARALLDRAAQALGKTLTLAPAAIERLAVHTWPGNIRELRNTMDRAAAWCERVVDARDLEIDANIDPATQTANVPAPRTNAALTIPPPPMPATTELRDEVRSLEKTRILAALNDTAGNQSQAAKILGISRHTLMNRLEEYGVTRPRKKR